MVNILDLLKNLESDSNFETNEIISQYQDFFDSFKNFYQAMNFWGKKEIKYGINKIEFEKGKNGIEANSLNELEKVVEVLKKAVAEGELDDRINSVADVISRRIHKRSE